MLNIQGFLTPYMQSYCYIVSDNNHAIIIDPCEIDEIKSTINSVKLDYCILTHEHYDHISGLEWIHTMKVPVIASQACDLAMKDTKKNQSRYFEVFSMLQTRLKDLPIPHVDEYIGSADLTFISEKKINWLNHEIYLKETPGHSEGGICIIFDNKYMFCGDTIFLDYETNTNILGGSIDAFQMITLPWLHELDDSICVYPGHYNTFTMKEWKIKHDDTV